MSKIIFTSRTTGTAELHGSERFHLLAECNRIAYNTPIGEGPGGLPGIPQLNACLSTGLDLAILIARLSGQVELICWVDGEHRAWLATMITKGLGTGLLRAQAGWPEVVRLLECSAAEPVFIYTTQGLQWPHLPDLDYPRRQAELSSRPGPADWRESLPDERYADRWERGEALLRAESEQEDATAHLADHPTLMAAPFSRELRPSNWQLYFFAE